jgi:hypothetical protein
MRERYKGFINQDAIIKHNIRGIPSFKPVKFELGRFHITFQEVPPIRCYYACRNNLYFALYGIAQACPRLVLRTVLGLARLNLNFLLRPRHHGKQILACFRGLWHGVSGNIAARY